MLPIMMLLQVLGGQAPGTVLPPPSSAQKPPDTLTIALLPIKCSDGVLAATSTVHAAQALRDLKVFRVLDPESIGGMVSSEMMQQAMGCESTSCLAEIGGAVGAAHLVSGSVTASGAQFLVSMTLTDQKSMQVLDGATGTAESSAQLAEVIRRVTQSVVRKLLIERTGVLQLVSRESGADVRIDGVLVGTTPIPAQPLPMGMHTISVEKEGFIAHRQDVLVEHGRMLAVRADVVPGQQFVDAYNRKNRTLRALAWLTTGTAVALGVTTVGAYLAWQALYLLAVRSSGPIQSLRASAELDPRRILVPANHLADPALAIPLNALLVVIAVTPGFAIAAAIASAVFWIVGENPSRYDEYRP